MAWGYIMTLSEQQLRRIIREAMNEQARIAVPPVNNKDEAEDLLHDTFLAVENYLSLEEIQAIIAQLF